MKVALIGATGNVGTRLIDELTSRGHQVTAIARNVDKLKGKAGVTAVQADAKKNDEIVLAIKGHDAVISSLRFADTDPAALISAVKQAGAPRYLVVGGAASLKAPGTDQRIVDSGQIPEEWMPEIRGGVRFLDTLKEEKDLDWTFLSPSMFFGPGERTGKFRLGSEELLVADDGKSSISYEDFSIAMVDEIEQPKHHRARFTVGY